MVRLVIVRNEGHNKRRLDDRLVSVYSFLDSYSEGLNFRKSPKDQP